MITPLLISNPVKSFFNFFLASFSDITWGFNPNALAVKSGRYALSNRNFFNSFCDFPPFALGKKKTNGFGIGGLITGGFGNLGILIVGDGGAKVSKLNKDFN